MSDDKVVVADGSPPLWTGEVAHWSSLRFVPIPNEVHHAHRVLNYAQRLRYQPRLRRKLSNRARQIILNWIEEGVT